MEKEYVISDDAFNEIQDAIRNNENWIAYNTASYFLEKEDIFSFTNQGEASDFTASNISEYDNFKIIYAESAVDVFRQISYGNALAQQLFISSRQNLTIMNEQNFEYLSKQLFYNGFGENLQRELREKMQQQQPDFNILHTAKFGNDQTEAMLHFKKSEKQDMYFLNRYFLQLKNDQGKENFTQSFNVGRENNITLKEAYNMMNGRAVYKEMTPKEGEKYHAWLQLNFKETNEFGDFKIKQLHQNYGFDLKATLANYPIKELQNTEHAQNLMRSLEKGNRQSVTLLHEGREQKVFIEASPQYKSMNVYDENNKRMDMSQRQVNAQQQQNQSQASSQSKEEIVEKNNAKQQQKQHLNESKDAAEESGGKQSQRRSKKHKQSHS